MFRLIEIAALVLYCLVCVSQADKLSQWKDFKIKFNRSYNESENEKRFKIFEENCLKIEKHNELESKGKETFRLGINRYGDLTFEEVVQLHLPSNNSDELDG